MEKKRGRKGDEQMKIKWRERITDFKWLRRKTE